jgi:hypothetical protein
MHSLCVFWGGRADLEFIQRDCVEIVALDEGAWAQQLCGVHLSPRTGAEVVLALLLPVCITQAVEVHLQVQTSARVCACGRMTSSCSQGAGRAHVMGVLRL